MAYTINLTNDAPLVTISDGTVDADATNLVLIGKNYTGYGEFIAENFVRMLENSANIETEPPAKPLVGQLWFDTTNNVLKVADNAKEFKPLGTVSPSITEPLPSASSVGDIWYDTVNKQVNVYTGSEYILVGGDNVSGSAVTTILDSGSAPHIITTFYADGEVVAAASADPAFTVLATDALFAKFPTIGPGFQLAQSVAGGTPQFIGDATNALALGGTLAADFLSSVSDDQTSGTLTVLNDGGLTVGTSLNGKLYTSGTAVVLENGSATGNIFINSNGTPVITIDGALDKAIVSSPTPGTNQIASANYVDTAVTGLPYVELDGTSPMTGGLSVNADAGVLIGSTYKGQITTSGNDLRINNTLAIGDIFISSNNTNVITIDGSLNKALVSNPTAGTQQIANAAYVDAAVAGGGTDTMVGMDFPDLYYQTVQVGSTGAWTTITVNANARFAFVNCYTYGIFDTGGGSVIGYARKKGLSGAAGPRWEVTRTGSASGDAGSGSDETNAGSTLVECDASGRIELYGRRSSTSVIAPSVHFTIKGWIE